MEEKKNKIIYLSALAMAFLLLFIFIIRLEVHLSGEKEKNKELIFEISSLEGKINSISQSSLPVVTEEEKSVKYIIKENDGKIGVFDTNGKLLKTIDTLIEFLPKTDRELLNKGIELYSDEELFSIIEDYSS